MYRIYNSEDILVLTLLPYNLVRWACQEEQDHVLISWIIKFIESLWNIMLTTAEEEKKKENSVLEAHNLDDVNVKMQFVSPLTEVLLGLLGSSR